MAGDCTFLRLRVGVYVQGWVLRTWCCSCGWCSQGLPQFIITVKSVLGLGCSYGVLWLSGGVVVFEVRVENPPCPGHSRGKTRPGVGSGSRSPPKPALVTVQYSLFTRRDHWHVATLPINAHMRLHSGPNLYSASSFFPPHHFF